MQLPCATSSKHRACTSLSRRHIKTSIAAADQHQQYGNEYVAPLQLSPVPTSRPLPAVDWSRYHLQVLFVDKRDTIRARVAAGLFNNIAAWNGWGRALVTETCGIDAVPNKSASLSTVAALMQQAYLLGLVPKAFAKPAQRFDQRDLDLFDIVVVLDSKIRARVLDQVPVEYREDYSGRVCLLTDFSAYPGDSLFRRGANALLPSKMASVLQPAVEAVQDEVDIHSPIIGDTELGKPQWNTMVYTIMLGCAGLVKYLMDMYPKNLPEYDPL